MVFAKPRPLRGLTILVVDDHLDTVDSSNSTSHFPARRLSVRVARNPHSPCSKATRSMPRWSIFGCPAKTVGWLLRQLRASQTASAQAPVYAMTGERHDYLDPASGFAGYFFKPVDFDALVAALAVLPRRPK
jgi:DNA-binding response OmpR family regulator